MVYRSFPRFCVLIVVAVLASLTMASLVSCGGKFTSYGVVIWSEGETVIPTGSIVGITARSALKKTFQIRLLDDKGEATGNPISASLWRIQQIASFGDAQNWLKKNQELIVLFGQATKQALPVREKPLIQTTNIIYRLRDQEKVKIVGKQDKESEEGGIKAFWYEIMTDSGTRGWVFGNQLEVFQPGVTKAASQMNSDAQTLALATGHWRPEDFVPMLETKKYDLDLFGADRGFRLDPEKKRIHISVAKDVLDFSYQSLDKLPSSIFLAQGAGVQISFRDDKTIIVEYQKSGTAMTRVFVNMDADIESIWNDEMSRRAGMVSSLRGKSGTITSENYGSISINPDGSFLWEELQGLQPNIVPSSALGTGKISFNIYPEGDLAASYRGVVSFQFNLPSGTETIHFLFRVNPEGVQLEYLPRSFIKGNLAKRADANPMVLFFAY